MTNTPPPHAGRPAAQPRPAPRGRAPGPARPAPRRPGCLASLFLDITGLSFLAGIKKKLGGPGFAFAFLLALLFMFLIGARIERYGHLGEHQYVMQILPMAGCFSPVLALLMTAAFGIGDCLTNATFWLFPQSSVLNMYTLFKKPGPLLTWGAYARMDFITLPLYAILPGLGSRILYSIVSRAFQAGRAKIMKDGGAPDKEALQRQLNQALQEQGAAAQRQQAAMGKVQQAEGKADAAAESVRTVEAREEGAARSLQEANARTQDLNRDVQDLRTRAAHTAEDVSRAEREVQEADRVLDRNQDHLGRTDAELRQSSHKEEELKEKLAEHRADADAYQRDVEDSLKKGQALRQERDALAEMERTGRLPDGRPLTPEGLQKVHEDLQAAEGKLAAERSHFEEVSALKAKADRKVQAEEKELEDLQERNEQLLERYRKEQEEVERAERLKAEAEERLRAQEAENEAAQRQMAKAQEEAQRSQQEAARRQAELSQAQAQKAQAVREYERAMADRNAAAWDYNQAAQAKAQADSKVAQLQSALGIEPTPAAGKQEPLEHAGAGAAAAAASGGSRRRRPASDPYRDAIWQYDQAMYAEMARRAREREMMMRLLQERNRGLLPNGLGGEVAGMGAMAGQGLAGLGAAVAGAAAGGIVGAGLVHGHMWAEYNPIRVWVHPSHTADVGCYKMDVGYLDDNLASGVSSASAVGPGAVVGADSGGVPPPGGPGSAPGTGPAPPGPPGQWVAQPGGQSDEEKDARDAAQKARDEAQKYKDMWEESEKSADKSDPGYQKLKDQYDDYIKSQEDAAADAEGRADALKGQREADEAAAKEAADRKAQWISDRQEDLKAAAEEKAHLEAVIRGAQQGGFDTSEHQTRLNQLNERLGQLHGQLGKEGADIDYTARDRGTISVGKEFAEAGQKAKEQADLLDHLQKMQRAAFDHGMVEPGADGQRGDIYGKVGNMINDLLSGKKLDPDKIQQVRDYIGGRMDGTYGDPSRPPGPEKPWYADGESWKNAFAETGRNLSTCQTSDGKFSWMGLGGRIAIGALTGGGSEFVFVPMGGLQVTKDAVDRGADGFEAWKQGMTETIKQELIGKFVGGLFHVGGKAFGGMVGAELAGKNMFKGAARGAWTGLGECGEQVVKEAGEISWTGLKNSLAGGAKAIGNGASRLKDIATGEEGLTLGFGKAGAEGAEQAAGAGAKGVSEGAEQGASKSPLIGTEDWARQQQIRRAAATGDPDVVAGLYRDGGMKDLIEMQKKGYVSANEAKAINSVLREEVNQSIRQGTKDAIEDFQSQTGVKVKEVLVGDSGSSAQGPPSRFKTDADRTLITTFDDASVKDYASKRGISESEAYDELSKKFTNAHEANVNQSLQDRTGLTADDVDYKSYDRIGGGSGKSDSYAEGFTNSRQAGQGSGEKYTVNPDGTARDPVRVSGQTVVDQNQLTKAKYDPDYTFPEDATKIPPSEIPSVLEQQTASIGKHPDDPLTIAKAVGRTEKVANVVGESLGDPRLTQTAREIYENPGRMDEILKKNGFVDAAGNPDPSAFCNQGSSKVVHYSAQFPHR